MKQLFNALDRLAREIAQHQEIFDASTAQILQRLSRNVSPLREMTTGAYRLRLERVLANHEPERDVLEHITELAPQNYRRFL